MIRVVVGLLCVGLVAPAAPAACANCEPVFVKRNVVHHAPVVAKVVEQAVAYPVAQNVYYFVGQAVRDYAIAPQHVLAAEAGELERKIAGLQDQLAQYRQQQQAYSHQPSAVSSQPYGYAPQYTAPPQQQQSACAACEGNQQPPAQLPPPSQGPPQTPPAAGGPPTFSMQMPPQQQAASGIIEQQCMKCHNAEKAKGGVDFTGPISDELRMNAVKQVISGEMPKGGQLSDAERGQFLRENLTADELRLVQMLTAGSEGEQQ